MSAKASEVTTYHSPGGRRYWLASAVFVVWLLVMALSFWWFQFRYISSFEDYWASFEGAELQLGSFENLSGRPTIVHFVDPDCPCSRFSWDHIADLERELANRVDFIRIGFQEGDNVSPLPGNLNVPAARFRELKVPATPAVGIWSASGEMAYFGPYSSGAFCGDGDDFVLAAIDALESGENPRWLNNEAVGCFCAWSAS